MCMYLYIDICVRLCDCVCVWPCLCGCVYVCACVYPQPRIGKRYWCLSVLCMGVFSCACMGMCMCLAMYVCMCMFTFMRMCMFQWVCIRCWGGNVPFRSYLNVPFRPPYRGEGRVETGHYHPERWARTGSLPPLLLMKASQHNSFDSLRSIRASVRSSAIRSSEVVAVFRLFVRLIVCSSVRPRKRLC